MCDQRLRPDGSIKSGRVIRCVSVDEAERAGCVGSGSANFRIRPGHVIGSQDAVGFARCALPVYKRGPIRLYRHADRDDDRLGFNCAGRDDDRLSFGSHDADADATFRRSRLSVPVGRLRVSTNAVQL